MEYYALTDIGKIREKNQDQAATAINLKDQILGVVCDGMGGHKAGEIASHVVEEHVLTCFKANPPFLDDEEVTNWLMDTVLEAHQIVKRMANMQEDTKGMGTTVVAATIENQMMYFAAWEFLRRIARENRLDKTVINNLNKINAESLMCDLLPIPEIA